MITIIIMILYKINIFMRVLHPAEAPNWGKREKEQQQIKKCEVSFEVIFLKRLTDEPA